MAESSAAAVVFIVLLSLVVVFLGLVVARFWYQNRSLKRRIDYYIGVLDTVKRHVDFAIFSDPTTTQLQESHRSEGETDSATTPGGTPGEGVQAKTQQQPSSGDPSEYEALEANASVPSQQPSVPQEEGVNNEYSVLSWSSQGLETLRRAANYLELTLQYSDASPPPPYTPLFWLKKKKKKQEEEERQKEDDQNSTVFGGQRIDYRRNPQAPHMPPPSSSALHGQWKGGCRPGQGLVVVGGGGGGGGRLPPAGKHFPDKWQQRQSALISDELITNFRSRATNLENKDRYIYQDVCGGASQQQQQQPRANTAAANRGHGGGGEELKDIEENAKLKDSLNIQPATSDHHRNQRHHPMDSSFSSVTYELTEPRQGIRREEAEDAVKKSAQDTDAKCYVNINYVEKAKRKQTKSSKYTNLPF